jgi:hypothetical protein
MIDHSPDRNHGFLLMRKMATAHERSTRLDGSLKTGNKVRLHGVLAVVKQVVVSNETRTHCMQHSSVVLRRSVSLRRLGSSFSPEAGARFFGD